jgi:hypothetical protein
MEFYVQFDVKITKGTPATEVARRRSAEGRDPPVDVSGG